jgi:serine O-acetyltransferase
MKTDAIQTGNGAKNGLDKNGTDNLADHHALDNGWDLARIVTDLRAARTRSRQGCIDKGDREMPSREALRDIMAGFFGVMYPDQFGRPDLTEEGIDYFVGHRLDETLRALNMQIQRELQFSCNAEEDHTVKHATKALRVTREFAAKLPQIAALLESDVRAGYQGDPAAKSIDEVRFCYPGVTAITHHRIAHELYAMGLPLLARIIAELAHSSTGIDIHPGATIGGSFFIDHGTGVVIGETAVIGERVRLYQAVTLGAKSFQVGDDGALVKGVPRHPIVEDDVVIYAGATILGRIRIGRGATIGGNVWITRDIPPASRVAQAQARNEAFSDGGGI